MRWLVVFGLWAGCSISEQDFSDRSAEALCKRAEQCDELAQPIEDCIASVSAVVEGIVDLGDALGSEYDPGQGGVCVRHIRALECDELDDWADDDECEVMTRPGDSE